MLDTLDNQLPEIVWRRRKMGFTLPFERWMRSSLGDEIESTLRKPQALSQIGIDARAVETLWRRFIDNPHCEAWSRPWALYVLDRWCAVNEISA